MPEQESRGPPDSLLLREAPPPAQWPHRLQGRLLAGLRVSAREDRLSEGRLAAALSAARVLCSLR